MRAGRSILVLLGLMGLALSGWASGCGTFYDDCHKDPAVCAAFADGGGGSGGIPTTGGTGGTGGSCPEACTDGNPCTDDLCNQGKCENPPNDTIVPTDPNPCTTDLCKDGVASHTNAAAGTPCGNGLKCDAGGVCQCTSNDQCGIPTDCVKPTCDPIMGCVMLLSTDTLPDPTPNDCKGIKCDGMGHAVAYNEDLDKPADDGVVCTDDVCESGVPSHPASAVGTPCMGGNVCKAANTCVFCTGNLGCDVAGGEYCFNEAACASCTDMLKNGDESDLDCGGSHCPQCDDGKNCQVALDCKSDNCNSGQCISCTDMVANGNESDVDCGGGCPKCVDGKTCNVPSDCVSGMCLGGKCISCFDGIKNGAESDVDCGGTCPKCATGKACMVGGNCTSNFCAEGICCGSACGGTCLSCNLPGKFGACGLVPSGLSDPGTCSGGMLCDGGGTCANSGGKKGVGGTCLSDSECFNNVCQGICKLQIGDPCASNSDCESFHCLANVCANCNNDNECPNNNKCTNGLCRLSNGEFCASSMNCQSGFCAGNPKKCQ